MREMFRQIFATITTLFRTVERSANAIESCAKWAEAEAAHLEKEASIEREAQITALKAGLLPAIAGTKKAA